MRELISEKQEFHERLLGMFNAFSSAESHERLAMSQFAGLQANITRTIRTAANHFCNHNYIIIRGLIVALFVAAPLLMPRAHQAQEDCPPAQSAGCFVQPKRDIAFLIDATGSIEQRGQTYNIQIEGVRRAISDPTVIPRDGSVAVAIIIFNEGARVVVPLTEITSDTVAAQIATLLQTLKCTDFNSLTFPCPFGATFYSPAIQAANIELSRVRNQNPKPGVSRVFVLSSDGLTNDLNAALKAIEAARIAATEAGLAFELDFLLLGETRQSPLFQTALFTANQLVTPPPASDLPGKTFIVDAGSSNLEGASPNDPDAGRQANDFAEAVRQIVRGPVVQVQPVVTDEKDTAPGTAIGKEGTVSLRQAIELANCNGGAATITFAENLKDKTIQLQSMLPPITAPDVTISGCTFAADICTPSVTIDGGGALSDGIVIRSNRVTVRGMKITNFTHAGIVIAAHCPQDNVGHNLIEQNVIAGSSTGILVLGDTNLLNKLSRNEISRPTPAADAPASALIDLGGDGPTPNDDQDADSGPNTLLNFPDAMLVTAQDDTVTIRGVLDDPPPGGATVEIFGVTSFHIVDNRVVIDGVTFLGQTTADGEGEFAASGLTPSPTGIYTATATDLPNGSSADQPANTSELMFDAGDTILPRPIADITATVDFGDVTLNTPVTKPVTINNPGAAPLAVTGCAVGRCPDATSDTRARFSIAGCPTAVINPGQSVTINVTVNATACGALAACLLLETDDPRRPQVAVPLTASATTPASLVVQGGVTQLKFKRVPPRGAPVASPPTKSFTISNTGCQSVTLTSATLARGGQTDDGNAFIIAVQGGFPATLGGGQSLTITVAFNPVIPRVASGQVRPRDLLPSSFTDTLTIATSAGSPITITLIGGVKPRIRFIDPNDPNAAPVVTLCRSGDEFLVTFSAYDANTNLSRAVYQFKDSAGRTIGLPITVDNLGSVLQQQGIQPGQSFTLTQRFTGANDNKNVSTVGVEIFDGESSDTATSSALGANCSSAALQTERGALEMLLAATTDRQRLRRRIRLTR
jgi:Abnormal spindle-like microcephaly-assoc'd, ASPM-SPD-2-Hydin